MAAGSLTKQLCCFVERYERLQKRQLQPRVPLLLLSIQLNLRLLPQGVLHQQVQLPTLQATSMLSGYHIGSRVRSSRLLAVMVVATRMIMKMAEAVATTVAEGTIARRSTLIIATVLSLSAAAHKYEFLADQDLRIPPRVPPSFSLFLSPFLSSPFRLTAMSFA